MNWNVRLERLVNVALIVAALAFVGTQVKIWFHTHAASEAAPAAYETGEVIPAFGGLTQTGKAIVLFVNSNCMYCTESMGFYGRLSDLVGSSRAVTLAAASRQTEEVTRGYLSSHEVDVGVVKTLAASEASRLQLTPTVLLVEPNGQVVRVWTGKLNAAGEDELLTIARQLRE